MANIVGLNDGNLLSADNIYDSNQATDQQTINSEVLDATRHFIPFVCFGTGQTKLTVKIKANAARALLVLFGMGSTTGTVFALFTQAGGTRHLGYITTASCTFSNWTWTISGLLANDVYAILCTHEIESWSVS